MTPKQTVRAFFTNSHYLTLSTTDGVQPWSTPLYFATDKENRLYFVSRKDSKHSQNIQKNPNISFCIFNSESDDFSAQCVQASGKAYELKLTDALHGLLTIYQKKHPTVKDALKRVNFDEVSDLTQNRVYVIQLNQVFVLDESNPDMDTRVEVVL